MSYRILEEQCNNYIPQIHLQHQILSPESTRHAAAWWAAGRRWLLQKCKADRPVPCTATELHQYKCLPQSNACPGSPHLSSLTSSSASPRTVRSPSTTLFPLQRGQSKTPQPPTTSFTSGRGIQSQAFKCVYNTPYRGPLYEISEPLDVLNLKIQESFDCGLKRKLKGNLWKESRSHLVRSLRVLGINTHSQFLLNTNSFVTLPVTGLRSFHVSVQFQTSHAPENIKGQCETTHLTWLEKLSDTVPEGATWGNG